MKKTAYDRLIDIIGPPAVPPDSKGNAVFFCQNCGHTKPHLIINVESELYHCWICEFKGRGIKWMLNKLGYVEESRTFEWDGKNIKARSIDGLEAYLRGYTPKIGTVLSIPEGYTSLYKKRKDLMFVRGYRYLINRGITDDDILRYSIMFSPRDMRVLIPSYDKDFNLNYYITRTIEDVKFMKYKNAEAEKKDIIFNEFMIDWSKAIILVEGIFDAIAAGHNAVPVLGSTVNYDFKIFQEIVKHRTDTILCFDPDASKKQMQVGSLLRSYGINVNYIDTEDCEGDIADLGRDRFNELLSSNIKEHGLHESILAKFM